MVTRRLVLGAAAALLGRPAAAQSGEPLRIGWLAALTGPSPAPAVGFNRGVVLAVAELNAAGGVLGRPVELVTRDTQGDPARAANAAKDLISRAKVHAIWGPTNSAEALAVLPGSGNDSLADAGSALRRAGTDGLLVAVLGRIDPSQAQQVARWRRGATVAIAVLLDTARWAPVRSAATAAGVRDHAGAAQLLRAAGWRVLEAGPHDTIAQVWPRATAEGQLAGDAARDAAYGPLGSAPGPALVPGEGVS